MKQLGRRRALRKPQHKDMSLESHDRMLAECVWTASARGEACTRATRSAAIVRNPTVTRLHSCIILKYEPGPTTRGSNPDRSDDPNKGFKCQHQQTYGVGDSYMPAKLRPRAPATMTEDELY